jgi:hypothetical protein
MSSKIEDPRGAPVADSVQLRADQAALARDLVAGGAMGGEEPDGESVRDESGEEKEEGAEVYGEERAIFPVLRGSG